MQRKFKVYPPFIEIPTPHLGRTGQPVAHRIAMQHKGFGGGVDRSAGLQKNQHRLTEALVRLIVDRETAERFGHPEPQLAVVAGHIDTAATPSSP